MAKSTKTSKTSKTSRAPAEGGALLKMSFKLDPKKVEEIQRCLRKGRLTITVSSVDLAKGGATNGYLYD